MSEFDAYLSLAEISEDDHRWAFGTGFADPLAGVDAGIPAGVDPAALAACCLGLADDALIYSHRLQQWLTRAPELEEETALANIALDLLGQARMLLTRAAQAEGRGGTRTSSPSSGTSASSATSGWWNGPTTTSPSWRPAAHLLGLAARGAATADLRRRPGARRDRREEREGARLPPRVRRRLGDPPRRRHRPVARQNAGRPRNAMAAGRRAGPAATKRTASWTPSSTRPP